MNPAGRVHELLYGLDSITPFSGDAEPIRVHTESGEYRLAQELLRVRPPRSFSTVAAARAAVEPFLRAWEFEHAVRTGIDAFRFVYLSAEATGEAIDVEQYKPELRRDQSKDSSPIVIELRRYPEPPSIRLIPEMQAVWERFSRVRCGFGEPLQGCAYFALTVAESLAGGRKAAVEKYGLSADVLRKLGELTSVRGENRTARKGIPSGTAPLSRNEERWIDAAVRHLLLQIGLEAAGGTPGWITMSDLPTL